MQKPGGRRRDFVITAAVVAGLFLASAGAAYVIGERRKPSVYVGSPKRSVQRVGGGPAPVFDVARPDIGRHPIPEPPPSDELKRGAGGDLSRAVPFRDRGPSAKGAVTVLFVGSDARPGEDPLRARADSLHLAVIDSDERRGVLIGLPRDAWVPIPGRTDARVNDALRLGGPDLLVRTVEALARIRIDYWVLADFGGLMAMTDALGGLDVRVDRRMNDAASGARFERGVHHFDGADALAFSRNRNDAAYSDFSRSENQGHVMLAALAKLRSEVRDLRGIRRWLGVLTLHVRTDLPPEDLLRLAVLARHVPPESITNLVVPGRVGRAGSRSVVVLDQDAGALFAAVREQLGAAASE